MRVWLCALLALSRARAAPPLEVVTPAGPVVTLAPPAGPVRGAARGDYATFLGVPYARVDEENPFGPSSPIPNFKQPLDALDGSIQCPQPRFPNGTLQCLRLNLYVPQPRSSAKLPVFVWFHGGGFVNGYAGLYGGEYLVQRDIIVVTVNYRLGPYGFLCLNDPRVPGNQGLKDQVDALKWIKDNIEAFGGDAEKVTIAGESSGGGAVDLHLYSNYDKYFDKAVIQSGGAKVEGLFVKPDYDAAVKLAKLLNHTARSNTEAIKFLAKANPADLVEAFKSSGIQLGACKEKKFKNVQSFITKDPFHLNNPKKVQDTPVLIGYNSKEFFAGLVDEPEEYYEKNQDMFYDNLNGTFKMKEKDLRKLADIVQKFYLGSKPVSKENMLAIMDFMSDFVGAYAAENAVNRLVHQGARLYKYIFSYTGNSPYKNVTGVGAFHTEELQYLFLFKDEELTEPEHFMMRDRMTTLWANFVKYGDPTPETSALLPTRWPVVPRGARPCLDIDRELAVMQDVHHARVAFWELLWNTYWRRARIIS